MKVAITTKFPRTVRSHISLIVIFVATSFVPAFGQTFSDRRMLEMSYDSKYYSVTADLAGDILKRRPNDEYALYYLGRSLARLGRNGAARLALVKCQRLSRGTDLGLLADQAVTELLPYDVELDKAKVDTKVSSVNTQERQRLLAEQEKELDAAQQRFDKKIEQYQKNFSTPQLNRLTQLEFEQLSRSKLQSLSVIRSVRMPYCGELHHRLCRSFRLCQMHLGECTNTFVRMTLPGPLPFRMRILLHAKALKLGSVSKKGAAVKAASKQKPDGK